MNDVSLNSSRLSRIDDAATWDEFLLSQQGHVLQSHAWGQLKARFGWKAERWARLDAGRLCAGAQVLSRTLLPGLRIAYVPRGPVSADSYFVKSLIESMRSAGVFLFTLEPDWMREDPRNALLAEAGFLSSDESIQPPATIRVDLTRPAEAILAGMKPKWRYNIRLAERKGVLVRPGTAADLSNFYELILITAERDRFAVHPLAYYRSAFELLTQRDRARLFVAEYLGSVLAMIFVTSFGCEAIYLYGGSGNRSRNVMPNHALHWAAMLWAKARGCEWYDLWGVPERWDVPQEPSPQSVLQADKSGDTTSLGQGSNRSSLPDSLAQFKSGFGGQVLRYAGAWDYIFSPTRYTLYRLARQVRRNTAG
jgi:lipid II:glycine glycyltransferase (peptidoglycan interpeptide bridge formation enzyme)